MSLPTPYYDEDGITVYLGDCRDVLPFVSPGVDCLLTDPPYGIGFRDYASHTDSQAGYSDFIWPVIETAEALVRPRGVVAVFQSEVNAAAWSQIIPRPFRLVSVCKTFGQVGREILMRQTDFVLYWLVGGWEWSRADWERVTAWQYPNARNWMISSDASRTRERWPHPCPRTLDAMRYLVACFCPPSGLILDPFMGSGTTLVAAKQLGRRAIGIEIEERYCAIAVERLRQTVLRFDAPADAQPVEQETML